MSNPAAVSDIDGALDILYYGGDERHLIELLRDAAHQLGSDWQPPEPDPNLVSEDGGPDFQLHVRPGLTLADTEFSVSGYRTGPAPDYDALAAQWVKDHHPEWGIHWGAVGRIAGKRLTPDDPRAVAHFGLTPLALTHHVFDNSGSSIPAHYSAELTDSITNVDSVEWNRSISSGVTYTVGVEVGEGPVKGSASTSVSLETTEGRSVSHSRTVDVGNKDGVDIEVPPGGIELAVLFVEQGCITLVFSVSWHIVGSVSVASDADARAGKPYIKLTGAELDRYLPKPPASTVSIQFDGESEIKTVTLADASPQTVDDAIQGVLQDARKDQ